MHGPMERAGFLATMTETFSGKLLSEGLATSVLGLFLTRSMQAPSINVVQSETHTFNRRPVNWPLIVHSLPTSSMTGDLLRNEHHSLASARIKHS